MNKQQHNIDLYSRNKEWHSGWFRTWMNENRMVCVNCGGKVTVDNFKYFNNNPAEVLCWECQELVKYKL